MKKVLIIHNKYQNIGGEDIAVSNEINFLKKSFQIDTIIFENTISNKFKQILSFILNNNKSSNKAIVNKINEFKPDIVYIHNTWFKVSLGIFSILEKFDIPVYLKVHNFRYFCTRQLLSSKHFDDKEFCAGCGNYLKHKYLINRYYKDSFLKSLLVLRYGVKYYKILKNNKINILVLTEFHKKFMETLGINQNKIKVFPNFTPNNSVSSILKKNQIIYAGRISEEKGIEEVILAFKKANIQEINLLIVGDGPDKHTLKTKYESKNIIFLGQLDNKEVINLISESLAVVTGTKLYEGQPTLLCEASMMSVPSFFPKSGGIEEFFPQNTMLSFQNKNYEELTDKFSLLEDLTLLKDEGIRNKKFINDYLNEEKLSNNFSNIISGTNHGT
tara:strand:+ start:4734 stop:5894 length:1161 start_codon:yes stop_codon:yes gene_type:complete